MRIEVPAEMYRGRLHEVNESVVAEYRATGGRLATAFAGAPILLLDHVGPSPARPTPRRSHTAAAGTTT